MSGHKGRVLAVTTPTVNLLSPWSFESLAKRRLRRRFVFGAGLLVLLLSAGWAVQHMRAAQAEQILAIEEAERASLTSETAELAQIRTFVTGVGKRKQTVSDAMGTEVRFSKIMSELAMATPADADLTNVAVTLTPPPAVTSGEATEPGTDDAEDAPDPATPDVGDATASACPGPDPFGARPFIGCLTLSGTAASRDAVGYLVIELDRSRIFVEPFISTTTATTEDGARVTFTGTVGVSPEAFTGRYDRIDALLRKRTH